MKALTFVCQGLKFLALLTGAKAFHGCFPKAIHGCFPKAVHGCFPAQLCLSSLLIFSRTLVGRAERGEEQRGCAETRELGTQETEKGMQRVEERGHYEALEKARGKGEQTWGSEEEFQRDSEGCCTPGKLRGGGSSFPQLIPRVAMLDLPAEVARM